MTAGSRLLPLLVAPALGGCLFLPDWSERPWADGPGSPDDDDDVVVVYGATAGIEAGSFHMGCPPAAGGCENDEQYHQVWLDTYTIDVYEVTVAAYAECVQDAECMEPESGGFCNWGVEGQENHPVTCENWYQAQDFCEWRGGRLPTEAEWERAARGTGDYIWPWGTTTPTCDRAVMDEGDGAGCGTLTTWPIGRLPLGASPDGVHDMAGNAWEWMADWYDGDYYEDPSAGNNPTGPDDGEEKTNRGGGLFEGPDRLRSFFRENTDPSEYEEDIGFRCVYD